MGMPRHCLNCRHCGATDFNPVDDRASLVELWCYEYEQPDMNRDWPLLRITNWIGFGADCPSYEPVRLVAAPVDGAMTYPPPFEDWPQRDRESEQRHEDPLKWIAVLIGALWVLVLLVKALAPLGAGT